jgi:Arm DNA-binding domain
MPRLALTDRFVAGAKTCDQQPQTDYFDSKCSGLALRVSETGVKSWTFLFSDPGTGKRARMTLGGYPALPLATARTKAIEAKGYIEGHRSALDQPATWRKPDHSGRSFSALCF